MCQYPNLVVHLCEDFINAEQQLDCEVNVSLPAIMHPLLTSIANLLEAASAPYLQQTLTYLVQNAPFHAKLITNVTSAEGHSKKLCLFMLSNLLVYTVGTP
jgi:hypothetical protein